MTAIEVGRSSEIDFPKKPDLKDCLDSRGNLLTEGDHILIAVGSNIREAEILKITADRFDAKVRSLYPPVTREEVDQFKQFEEKFDFYYLFDPKENGFHNSPTYYDFVKYLPVFRIKIQYLDAQEENETSKVSIRYVAKSKRIIKD